MRVSSNGIMLALALVFFAQVTERSEGPAYLHFLARHQLSDGSWGLRPDGCTCPDVERVVAPCDREKVAQLLRALADDDPAARDAAEKELRALGEPVIPHLLAAQKDPDPEVRGRCAALCRRLEFGAGGCRVEATALALLAFLGAGYSHLSKDEYGGICYGEVVAKAIVWLADRQRQLGSFEPADSVADVVAACALSEAYGMTASQALKDPAQAAIDRVAAAPFKDARGAIWKGITLKSAELSELHFPGKSYEGILEALKTGETAVAGYTLLSIFIRRNKNDRRLADVDRLD